MSVVGGSLWALQGAPAPRIDGLVLPPLASPTGGTWMDAVLGTRRPLDRARWKTIVIHHSGSLVDTPAAIEARHVARNIRGLGYHFVIGNGRGIEDGELHVGYRWLDQLPGAHVAGARGPEVNPGAIGICLVGDGNRRPFTQAQVRRLAQLVAGLARELDIPLDRRHVLLHSDLAPVSDPGRLFPAAEFHELLAASR